MNRQTPPPGLLLGLILAGAAASTVVAEEPAKLTFGAPRAAERGLAFDRAGGRPLAPSAASARDRDYARGLLTKYDKNGDRVLDRDEWQSMRGEPEKADLNRDGRLTFDEVAVRAAQNRRESEAKRGGAPPTDRRSYRLKTPTEKLPEGLPSWFAQRDRDGDGQVAMHEWSRAWSAATARDFASKDPNGDGIITPAEARR